MTFTVRYAVGSYSGTKSVNACDEEQAIAKVRVWARKQMLTPMFSETYEVVKVQP